MGLNWAEHTEEIAAPIETCFAAITDYESFHGWQDAVDSTEVIDRTPEGLGQDVRLFVDAKVRKIDYVLRYRYQRPTLIEWDFVEGNGMRAMDGHYGFESLGPELTRATYKLGADPAIPVPGMILRRTHKQLVERSVKDLKRESERRYAAGESPAPAQPAPAETTEEPSDLGAGSPYDALAGSGAESEQVPIGAADDWVPMAERISQPRSGDPREGSGGPERDGPPSGRGGSPADAAGDLLGKAVSTGREVAEGAMRAGVGAAEQAVEIGRETAGGIIRRVSRKLGGDRSGDQR